MANAGADPAAAERRTLVRRAVAAVRTARAALDEAGLTGAVLVLLLGLAGAAVSLGVLFVDRPFGWGSQAKDFVHEPEAQLWFFAIALQGALWTVLTVPVRDALRELAPFRRRSAAVLAGSAMTAGIAALAAGSRLAGPKYPLPGHLAKVLLLTAWGYCVALLEASASGSFKAGVAILTPLATSVVGLLLAAPK